MVLSMDRWVGKIAMVTGASSGIGAAIAEQLVRNGLIVVGLARRKEKVEELVNKLKDNKGVLYAYKCDMTKEAEILAAFKWIADNLGPVSILVNNAGLIKPTDLIGGDTAAWKTVLDTNVLGLCIATREAINQMKDRQSDGHIIHINSVAGHRVYDFPKFNVYCATKHAVSALAETLRFEINREHLKIKITSVSPGYVDTEILQNGIHGDFSVALQAGDIADACIYALSTPPHVQVSEVTVRPMGESF
ncbi:farnesol dehydrogenase-like [Cylas formicarius]|uniref:farnesol dehydrogenase-like n=1 Tax=Cylas formicarius TaxID=197179 RepID=UPI00295843D1|nr:farnesol dehydrogenase-like [Cylas formicarius]